MSMAACTKFETQSIEALAERTGSIDVTFTVELPGTKSGQGSIPVTDANKYDNPETKASVTAEADMTVQSLQVFVFLGDNLDVYGSNTGNSLTVQCTPGQRDIYVLANAPSLESIRTKNELLSTASSLKHSAVTACNNFEMIGNKTEVLSATNRNITVPIKHITSRVVVSAVTKQFKSAALDALEFKVVKMYLLNVAGDCTYGGDGKPTIWYNKLTNCNEVPELTYDEVNAVVTTSNPHKSVHTFYAYPNPTESDSDDDTWSPRYTRLVLETKLGADTFYYPISLPKIEGNKSYNIAEIKITRPGSTDPDKPVSYLDCSFTVTVEPWDDVVWTEGTTI